MEAAGDRVFWDGNVIRQEDLETVEVVGKRVNDEALNTYLSFCAEQTWESDRVMKVCFVSSIQWAGIVQKRTCSSFWLKGKRYPEGVCGRGEDGPLLVHRFHVVLVACNWRSIGHWTMLKLDNREKPSLFAHLDSLECLSRKQVHDTCTTFKK